jgi:hypothetical protein
MSMHLLKLGRARHEPGNATLFNRSRYIKINMSCWAWIAGVTTPRPSPRYRIKTAFPELLNGMSRKLLNLSMAPGLSDSSMLGVSSHSRSEKDGIRTYLDALSTRFRIERDAFDAVSAEHISVQLAHSNDFRQECTGPRCARQRVWLHRSKTRAFASFFNEFGKQMPEKPRNSVLAYDAGHSVPRRCRMLAP